MANRAARSVKAWTVIPSLPLNYVGDSTVIGGGIAFAAPGTVLRMIGEYTIGPTANVTATQISLVIVAIGIFSTDAFTLGATAMPDPGDEPDYPWLYWATHPVHFSQTASPSDPAGQGGSARHTFDVRSMRKFKPRETLGVVTQFVRVSGTATVTCVTPPARVLIGTH